METETGLFDKNNQSIHVGDVIRHKNFYCFVSEIEKGVFYPFSETKKKGDVFIRPCDCEIIKK